jgi:FKBP-type peptidyl-prolyl cis-trans isomerase FkpA
MIKQCMIAALLLLAACGDNGGDTSVMREIERGEAEATAAADAGVNVEEPQALPSGLILQFRRRGADQSLAQPSGAAAVLVHYEGKLADNGRVFDSSFARGQPAEFPLQAVVPGFSEAITHMRPGDEVLATFPGELGYGARGSPPDIPPNARLQFRIQLLAFQEPGGQVVGTVPRP